MKYRIAVALVLLVGALAWSVARAFQPLRPGDRAAGFQLPSPDGAMFRLGDGAPGKVVLVNFFTTW